MARRRTMFTLGFVVLALAVSKAGSQASATLTLSSGDRVPGLLVDLSGAGITVLVGGAERQIPLTEIAMIDFGGAVPLTPAEIEKLWSPGNHLVLLRNGASVVGELFDLTGAQPVRVVLKVGGSERSLAASEISRIYLSRPPASQTPPPPSGGAGERVIQVPARQQWTATGITVREGDTVLFEASGEIRLNREGNWTAQPAGSPDNRYDRNAPVPTALVGALIGRIGAARPLAPSGRPFAIGNQTSVVMPDSGALYLGINDSNTADNSGTFSVHVRVREVR